MLPFLFKWVIFFATFSGGKGGISPEDYCRQIEAHLRIGESSQALHVAQAALHTYPGQGRLYEKALAAAAAAHEEAIFFTLWKEYAQKEPEKAYERQYLEPICWALLEKGFQGTSFGQQVIALLGAALTQDVKALPFLLSGMRHAQVRLRIVAIELAAHYGDDSLKKEIAALFAQESLPEVRNALAKALATLHLTEALPSLEARVADPKTGAQEKKIAIQACVHIREETTEEELCALLQSPRAGLRELACALVLHTENTAVLPQLFSLLEDPHPEVQEAALYTLGILGCPLKKYPSVQRRVTSLAYRAPVPTVGVMASWLLLLQDPPAGMAALRGWLAQEKANIRAMAGGVLAVSGAGGIPLAQEVLQTHSDVYVRLNAARALIGQRVACREAAEEIARLLEAHTEWWEWAEEGPFSYVRKSTQKHHPLIPHFPERANQTVRLEMLNLLAILEYPGAEQAIRQFLQSRQWEVTGLAAEVLLGEGDESAIECVRELLGDKDRRIRCEAALVLATWGRDPSALPVLYEAYMEGDRELKIKILESLGRLGEKSTIPFLVARLQEPSLVIRMIAASILIQTFNH